MVRFPVPAFARTRHLWQSIMTARWAIVATVKIQAGRGRLAGLRHYETLARSGFGGSGAVPAGHPALPGFRPSRDRLDRRKVLLGCYSGYATYSAAQRRPMYRANRQKHHSAPAEIRANEASVRSSSRNPTSLAKSPTERKRKIPRPARNRPAENLNSEHFRPVSAVRFNPEVGQRGTR